MGWESRSYASGGGTGGGGGDFFRSLARFFNQSFPIGTYLDVHVRVHILFIIWVVLELLSSAGVPGGMWWSLRWTSLLFFSVLAHEFGHILGCRRVGGYANEILMWPLGGLAYCAPPREPWPEFVTVACGPLVNVVVGLGCFLTLLFTADPMPVSLNPFHMWVGYVGGWQGVVADLFVVNYALLLFNLVMVFYPFDGGRLVQIAIWAVAGYRRSMFIATRVGMGGAILIAIIGISQRQFLLVMIALFGFVTCYQQAQALRYADPQTIDEGYRRAYSSQQRSDGFFSRRNTKRKNAKQDRERKEEIEVDRILAKVRDKGLASLTGKEKKTLKRATERKQSEG